MHRYSLLTVLLVALGCGQADRPSAIDQTPAVTIDGSKYIAAAEPADSRHVIDLRKDAKDGEAVVIVGRVGGMKKPVVEGRAAFLIVDLSLKACAADPNCFDFM